jgi:hypothetical protein
MRRAFAILLWSLMASTPAMAADAVDAVARDYVELALDAQRLQPDLISVIAPQPIPSTRGKKSARDAVAIERALGALTTRLDGVGPVTDRLDAMRLRALRARIESLRVQMRPADAPQLPVAEEVARKFGFVPDFRPLAGYDAALDRLDKAMPGDGNLPERIDAMKKAAIVPPDRIEPVSRAAIAECRRRTAAHLDLGREGIELKVTDDPTFPAGATYAGGGKSIVTVSRVLPMNVDQVLQMACHEVYPGHHVHYVTLDRALNSGRGWVEFSVDQVGPAVPVAEAVAEYGVGLAFPVEERLAFERDVLFPLAGLTMGDPAQWRAYLSARSSILGASATVARDYLGGSIDHDQARRQFIRYRLQTPEAAGQLLKMLSAVGSYVIASDLGWYTIDRVMQGRSVEEQWRLLAQIEREPMLLDDIAALGEIPPTE